MLGRRVCVRWVAVATLAGSWGLAACVATETAGPPQDAATPASLVDLSPRRTNGAGREAGRRSSGALLAANTGPGSTSNFAPEYADAGGTMRPTASLRAGGGAVMPVGFTPTAGEGQAQAPEGGYRMNFEDAELKDVLQAVLGNMLGVTYTLAPNVTGRITISSSRTQSQIEVLSTLETALAAQNIAMTKVGATYRIAPIAVGGGVLDAGEALPGNGVSVVPLRYTSVATMTKLLSGFVVETDGLRVDPGRNAIVVRGPAPKREEVVRAVESFDNDWMQNQSVSIFEVRRARIEVVVSELTRIFDNETNGNSAGVIQFKPMTRLRAVLVMSKNPTLIKRAETWVRRLDRENESAAENVFVYRPRFRDAKELARVVSGLFKTNRADGGTGGGTGGSARGTDTFSASPFGGGRDGAGRGDGGGAGSGTGSGGGSGGASGMTAQPVNSAQTAQRGGMSAANFASTLEASGFDAAGSDGPEGGAGTGARRINLSINADPANNTVVSYADGETYQKVLAVLKNLDVEPLQVAINVTIAEVQLNDQLKYGIQYYLNSDRLGAGKNRGSIGLVDTATKVLQSKLPGFNFIGGGASSPDVVISALDSISKVQILSSPSLVVMENRPAVLQVGDQVPITTRQAQGVINVDSPIVNQVDFKDTGIILKLVPRVGQNDVVALEVEQEISNVAAGGDTLTPTISKRRVASSLTINSGQTVLLAGLISEKRHLVKDGIPYLARTLIGDLFGSRDGGFERTELVMFIRPVVVRNGEDAASVAEEFRSRLRLSGAAPRPGPARSAVYKP